MEAVVLAAVLTFSLGIAVAAAWASLSLAMYLIDRGAAWAIAPVSTTAWASNEPIREPARPARQPVAA